MESKKENPEQPSAPTELVAKNFYPYQQEGWLGVTPEISNKPMSARKYLKVKRYPTRTEILKMRVAISEFKQLLGVKNWEEAEELLTDKTSHKEKSDRAVAIYGKMFGLEGSVETVESKIEEYGASANKVIDTIKESLVSRYGDLSQSEEIERENNPFRLGLMLLDKKLNPQRRFEAKRKLLLMRLAGSIDKQGRNVDTENQYTAFNKFLNEHVWTLSDGQPTSEDWILSTHNLEDMRCEETRIITKEEAEAYELAKNQKIEAVERRSFMVDGKRIPVRQDTREKSMVSKIIKLLRKGNDNPAAAVEDEVGLMAVLDSRADIKTFITHLHNKAIESGSAIVFEDPEDTFGNSSRENVAIGGSDQIKMVKFHARVHGTRPEVLLLTNQEYLNYKLKDGVAHDEYEIERIFKSGVMNFLFPKDFYRFDREKTKNASIERVRRKHRMDLDL